MYGIYTYQCVQLYLNTASCSNETVITRTNVHARANIHHTRTFLHIQKDIYKIIPDVHL